MHLKREMTENARTSVGIYSAGPWSRRLRLASGSILFLYVTLHLSNHALGNIGLGAMQAMLAIQLWLWQGVIGSILLYGAFLLHGGLGVFAFYQRRFFGLRWLEGAQLVLGLAVPALLANHLADTRLALLLYGIPKQYPQVLATFWVLVPLFGALQVVVLIVAWGHGCIGMHYAFRLKPWYGRASRLLLVLAILLPVLALLGFVQGGREVARAMAVPAWRAAELGAAKAGTSAEAVHLFHVRDLFIAGWLILLALVLVLRGLRTWRERSSRSVAITYPDGRVVGLPAGCSVLEASLRIGFPHAAICGGRGRCSTCRVRVFGDPASLAPPTASESAVLARVRADPGCVRLACQLRPLGSIIIYPLIPPGIAARFLVGSGRGMLGEERFIVAMFVDLRDSTALVRGRLPYDAVFMLRRFVESAAMAVIDAGGVPNQFTGDGLLALFGLASGPAEACRAALAATIRLAQALGGQTETMQDESEERLAFGIGAHCGTAVVGEIGFGGIRTFTALGEVVHLAARLEQASRDLRQAAVISAEILERAGVTLPVGSPTSSATELRVRGHDRPLRVNLFTIVTLREGFGVD